MYVIKESQTSIPFNRPQVQSARGDRQAEEVPHSILYSSKAEIGSKCFAGRKMIAKAIKSSPFVQADLRSGWLGGRRSWQKKVFAQDTPADIQSAPNLTFDNVYIPKPGWSVGLKTARV